MDYSVRARIIAAGFRRVVGLVEIILHWELNDAARLMEDQTP
jgi:hypothetical protein